MGCGNVAAMCLRSVSFVTSADLQTIPAVRWPYVSAVVPTVRQLGSSFMYCVLANHEMYCNAGVAGVMVALKIVLHWAGAGWMPDLAMCIVPVRQAREERR